jgi:hypothetical protein
MKEKANQDIRDQIQQQGLKHWQVAEQIGITAERRQRTEKAIKELKG